MTRRTKNNRGEGETKEKIVKERKGVRKVNM